MLGMHTVALLRKIGNWGNLEFITGRVSVTENMNKAKNQVSEKSKNTDKTPAILIKRKMAQTYIFRNKKKIQLHAVKIFLKNKDITNNSMPINLKI